MKGGLEETMDGNFPPSRPPDASAPFEERAKFSWEYVDWFVSQLPAAVMPDDVRPTHLHEIEYQQCVQDPAAYVEMTLAELARQKTN
jgi:hypothetical protein